MIHTVPTNSAVLDLHFSPNPGFDSTDDGQSKLAVATSAGVIEIHSLVSTTQPDLKVTLECIQIVQAYEPSLLLLSLAFNPLADFSEVLAVTLSDGSVSVFDHSQPMEAHLLEAWTVAWSSVVDDDGRQLLYSGGDDSRICTISYMIKDLVRSKSELFHTRLVGSMGRLEQPECSAYNTRAIDSCEDIEPFETKMALNTMPGTTSPRATLELVGFDAKIHGAGVTAILPIKLGCEGKPEAEVLLTGSYDEYLRVLSPKSNGKWTVVAEERVGGGVWRLKYLSQMSAPITHHSRCSILASCMHAGARIVEISHKIDDTWSIGVFARLEEHESMNYGSDFVKLAERNSCRETTTVVSTSFYDRKLCVTQIPDLV